jgi:pimeloyl-ACP methyl ester carboxylesterase
VTFTRYSALSRSAEIAHRTLPPLTFRRGQQVLASKGQALQEQAIHLSKETFALYVPAGPPPKNGYGLLVFVAPWSQPTRPKRWRPPLDRHGLIFVAAANSGNEVSIYDRRLPLALLAYENVREQYPLDPSRVYVGGLSGGSRVAEIAALAYPDVFRGVLLNAGSDPIGGEQGIYLPPGDLLRKFQTTRLVYITGGEDETNTLDDQVSQKSMKEWCVFDVEVLVANGLGHETLDPTSLDRALDALDERSSIDPKELAKCNARIEAALSAKVSEIEAAIARGDRDGARQGLKALDGRYGGLAESAVADLDAKLASLENGGATMLGSDRARQEPTRAQ